MSSENNKQNEYSTIGIETLKKNKIEVLEMKNKVVSIGNRANQMEERISDIEDRNLEMIQKEERHEH